MRLVYFALASFWGFLAGSAAIVVGTYAAGQPLRIAPWLVTALALAALAAVGGGVVAAVAYRDAVR